MTILQDNMHGMLPIVDETSNTVGAATHGGRFCSISEIRETIGQGIFTPNFEQEFPKLFT